MDSGREQNYWPGFVDALSNVVLTLVFVLVIFVFALVMASNKVEKKMQEVVQAQQDQKTQASQLDAVKQSTDQEKDELHNQLDAVTAEVKKLRDQNATSVEEINKLRQQNVTAEAEVEKLREQSGKDASAKSSSGTADQTALSSENQDKHIEIQDKAQPKAQRGAIQVQTSPNNIVLGYPVSVAEMDDKSAVELGHVLEAVEKNASKHKILLRSIIGRESYSAARRLAYYRAINARNFLITKGGESPSNITTILVQPPQPEDGRVEIVFQKQ